MAATPTTAIPRNLTDTTRALYRLEGQPQVQDGPATAGLASMEFETAVPIRRFCSWQGKRNYEGEWWSSTTHTHIPFESLLERDALMALDFDPDVVAISAQPVALLWPHETPEHRYHVPDFFVRQRDGDGRLIDVKPPDRVQRSRTQFDMTRDLAHEIGWHYEVFTGLPEATQQNLRWLAGYRQDRYTPSPNAIESIVEVFTSTTPLQVGAYRAAKNAAITRSRALANIYHLLWMHTLRVDMTQPLSKRSEVWS